jgi:probable F420-dependent oxidoreductase
VSAAGAPPVGVMFANGARGADPEHALALARAAESAGCESLWAVQHVVMPVSHESVYPYSDGGTVPGGTSIAIPDPLVWLAWVGAHTERILLGTGVLVLPQQHPLVVAKQVATLDRLVGGRVVLGVGAGWLREEYAALDAEFDRRGGRMDEAIAVLRAAWAPGPCDFHGDHIDIDPVHVEPKPARPVPIVIGGHSVAAARRAGRLADGFFPLSCQGSGLERLVTAVREAAAAAGRDPGSVEITAEAPRSAADADTQARLGVGRIVVNAPHRPTADLDGALHELVASVRERAAR